MTSKSLKASPTIGQISAAALFGLVLLLTVVAPSAPARAEPGGGPASDCYNYQLIFESKVRRASREALEQMLADLPPKCEQLRENIRIAIFGMPSKRGAPSAAPDAVSPPPRVVLIDAPKPPADLVYRCRGDQRRVALIIANQTYGGRLSDLPSTAGDAKVIGDALCAQGFSVRQIGDADQNAMRAAIGVFQSDLEMAPERAIGFFYYSGHGAQSTVIGESFLVPARSPIDRRSQLAVLAIGIGEILRGVRAAAAPGSKSVFIVLDACREVAFPGETMGNDKGIGAISKQEGLFIAFSTRPGETARADNVFSQALANNLGADGKSAYDVFFDTRRDVFQTTRQFPWFEDGLLERVYLKRTAP